MPNQLANESSPYLKQHQNNPVNWYPWNETALLRARRENKPIFLSIGYSACHWCHVMAHESFESPNIAELLNNNFINIKVDREERPDIDDIYMQAVVMLTGQGGWPLSVFLTPDLKPFYGGTYFPPTPRHGLPSFTQVLVSIIETWHNQPDAVTKNAEVLINAIRRQQNHENPSNQPIDLSAIIERLHAVYDWKTGGWGGAPKFPQPMLIEFLIQQALAGSQHAYEMADHLLESMAQGGMYDLIGGGFHRYSTDINWLIPHFEKMLYDNAQLALTYLHAYALTGQTAFRRVAIESLGFIQAEMTDPAGGFYASMDADTTEGEGRYYAWEISELREALADGEFKQLQAVTGFNQKGNFDSGLNIIQLRSPSRKIADETGIDENTLEAELQAIFTKLRAVRGKRIPPGKDQKIIVEWNAMTIRAFAEAGLLLNQDNYLVIAKNAMDFVLENLLSKNGSLNRIWNEGRASQPGTLADYASLIVALHAVYQIDFEPRYYQHMVSLFEYIQDNFSGEDFLFYDTAASISDLIVRPRSLQDNATPSGNAQAAYAHWLLGNYEEDPTHFDYANQMIIQTTNLAQDHPTGFGFWLQVAGLLAQTSAQIALVSQDPLTSLETFLNIYRKRYRPFSIIASQHADIKAPADVPPILNDRTTIQSLPTAYVCRGFTCQLPVNETDKYEKQLDHN